MERIYQLKISYCEFEYNPDYRLYTITKVFEEPKTKAFLSLSTGMYQYTTPLIFNNLIQKRDKNNKVVILMNNYEWAKNINMVNRNYGMAKYNTFSIAEYLDINDDVVVDFIEKTNDSRNYYIK